MRKQSNYMLIILFLMFIFTIPILTVKNRNTETSNIENRTLAEKPVMTKASLLSGEYFNDFEEYFSDHIIGRNTWIKSHTAINMDILRKKNINDIVLAKEDILLPYFTEELLENSKKNLKNLPVMIDKLKLLDQTTKDYGGEFMFVGVPSQSSFFEDKYLDYMKPPKDYFKENEKRFFGGLDKEGIGYTNMYDVFMEDYNPDYYFKTDHHFSFLGAFRTYQEIIKNLDMNPLRLDEMNFKTLDKPILGSRNRQIYFLKDTNERMQIGYPKEEIEYKKTTNGEDSPKLYFVDQDERPNYGEVYMGGDKSEIVIETDRPELKSVLIFGDSFTNALEPLLYYHFDETRILDLRHFKEMDISEYIKDHKPDIVLMVRDDLNYGNLEGNGKIK